MGAEGELRIGLTWEAGRIEAVRIASTRPDVGRLLLSGRTLQDISALVPRLFGVCAAAQGLASELALAAAQGKADALPALLGRAQAAVSAEWLREAAWRALIDAPQAMGEAPSPAALAAARALNNLRTPADAALREAVAQASFGMGALAWRQHLGDDQTALQAWAGQGSAAAARQLAALWSSEGTGIDVAANAAPTPPALLPAMTPELAATLATALFEPAFRGSPLWQGQPAETGPLARRWGSDALLGSAHAAGLSPAALRQAARWLELAALLAEPAEPAGPPPQAGACSPAPGLGLAWVETSRGLLLHAAHTHAGQALRYAVLAPTEWNFHPRGALAQALQGRAAAGESQACRLAEQAARSLDPCVRLQVRVEKREASHA